MTGEIDFWLKCNREFAFFISSGSVERANARCGWCGLLRTVDVCVQALMCCAFVWWILYIYFSTPKCLSHLQIADDNETERKKRTCEAGIETPPGFILITSITSCPVTTLRLKKRRQLKQGQSDRALPKESQSDTDSKGSFICEPVPTTQLKGKNQESEKASKTESAESGKTDST